MQYREEFAVAMSEVAQGFISYRRAVPGISLALVAGQHVLIEGKAGNGKSELAVSTFSMFTDVPIFRLGVSAMTKLEDMFGQLIVSLMIEKGKQVRNIEGGLLTAGFAFLDELFDLPDMILRGALLNVLNERIYMSKDDPILHIPLHTVIATTNFRRLTEAIKAVMERFLVKIRATPVTNYIDKLGLTDNYLEKRAHQLPKLDYGGLAEMRALANASPSEGGIVMSEGYRLLHTHILATFMPQAEALVREQLEPTLRREPTPDEIGAVLAPLSQRTDAFLLNLSRANAVLHGRDHTVFPDIHTYEYGLLTIGANPELEALWSETCRATIPTRADDIKQTETLGRLAEGMHTLRDEAGQNSHAVNVVAGQAPTWGALQIQEWLGKSRRGHATNQAIMQELRAELPLLAPANDSTMSLTQDWPEVS